MTFYIHETPSGAESTVVSSADAPMPVTRQRASYGVINYDGGKEEGVVYLQLEGLRPDEVVHLIFQPHAAERLATVLHSLAENAGADLPQLQADTASMRAGEEKD